MTIRGNFALLRSFCFRVRNKHGTALRNNVVDDGTADSDEGGFQFEFIYERGVVELLPYYDSVYHFAITIRMLLILHATCCISVL